MRPIQKTQFGLQRYNFFSFLPNIKERKINGLGRN